MDKLNFRPSNRANEKQINQYKAFYKQHLAHLKNRQIVLNELNQIRSQFKIKQPKLILTADPEWSNLERVVSEFFTKYFSKELITLYNKEFKIIKPNRRNINQEDSWLPKLFEFVADTFESLNEMKNQEWSYKLNFLNFLYECLFHFGLHPNIQKRNPVLAKKFNLVVNHFYMSKSQQTDIRIMMTFEEFNQDFTDQYIKQKPIKIDGKLIPFNSIYKVKITTTLLKSDEIALFAMKKNIIWNDTRKDTFAFVENCIDETDKYHPNPFDEKSISKGLNVTLIEETKQWLISYPASFKLYTSALKKFEKENFERNVLDDLRLSLETLLKDLLRNQKSLENQLPEVGAYLKKRGAANEVTNMFHKLLEHYTKYQNKYVKHNDEVRKNEIEFVIDLTTTFIKYLLKK